MRGNIELLHRQPAIPAGERAEILADTTEEVDRLIRLVNQLLALARMDAGQKLAAEPVPLRPLVEDVCRQVKCLAPDLRMAYKPSTDGTALGDRDAIKQVLLILVDNAARHAAADTTVEVRTEALGDRVALHIVGQRAGDRAGGAAAHLRAVLPGRELAQRGRRGAGAGDREGTGGAAGRDDRGGEPGGGGIDVYGDAAGGVKVVVDAACDRPTGTAS